VMQIEIVEIHSAGKNGLLNEEWFVLENKGEGPFSTSGCAVGIGRGSGRLRGVGTLDPGFTLAPGEKVRVVTGNPGKKQHGKPPEVEGVRNYHLFQAEPLLAAGAGTSVALSLRQHEVARALFDPKAKTGVAAAKAE
jgi:hypothetical protein